MEMDPSNRFTLRLRWLCYLSRRLRHSPQHEAPIATVNPQVDSHSATSAPLPLGSCGLMFSYTSREDTSGIHVDGARSE